MLRRAQIALVAAALTGAAPESAGADGWDQATDVDGLSTLMIQLLEHPERAAAVALERRVEQGVPPAALIALLDAARRHPRPELEPLWVRLTEYRRPSVRGRALAALAASSPEGARVAVAKASDDVEPELRRLAVALARDHTTPATEQLMWELLGRDRELAAELGAVLADGPAEAP